MIVGHGATGIEKFVAPHTIPKIHPPEKPRVCEIR
jgi:hypothetical protein